MQTVTKTSDGYRKVATTSLNEGHLSSTKMYKSASLGLQVGDGTQSGKGFEGPKGWNGFGHKETSGNPFAFGCRSKESTSGSRRPWGAITKNGMFQHGACQDGVVCNDLGDKLHVDRPKHSCSTVSCKRCQ